ncbi:glucosaminidase domain-containing protein [Candidatus Pelagibacter sp.]|nr:glucosaminidase domain-containing protein [Candidatus Pelagibacter sp.]|tara:strand:- start:1557 stop:2690 length:1134 start_codon:yes stop_codon:yes gene_type:complete
MINKKIKFSDISKFLKKKGFVIKKIDYKKKFKLNNLNSISKTILSSLLVIFIFFTAPVLIKFIEERSVYTKDYENNSKKKLDKKIKNLDNQKLSKLDEAVSSKYVFEDVLQFEDLPSDVVRLSASTIEQLFKETNYSLNDVREKKLVKPVSLSLLPQEMKMIENTKKRKELFIQIILPLIIKENNFIKLDRIKLFGVLNKNKNTTAEKNWLEKKFKQYGVVNKDLSTLKIRMDEIPVSMAIAQAAKETGWGTSRFAQEGNALFGQWTWSGDGIKPAGAEDDSTHKVMKFKVLQASVKAYQRNLNTHSSYRQFRSARADFRDRKKPLDSIALTEHLDKYAETGKEYVRILQQIIRQNELADFDDAKLLPSSISLESLI